jgi:hypothetical protein
MAENKTLNFDVPYLALNKQPVFNEDKSVQTLGMHFAITLSSIGRGDPIILINWANSIYNKENITVNPTELAFLTEVAKQCPLPAILRSQLIKVLNSEIIV